MKKLLVMLLGGMALAAAAGEREDLLKTFEKENIAAAKILQEAMTTVEMTGAAGNLWAVAENQLYQALDYKLRQCKDRRKRQKLLKDFHTMSREVQKIFDTPREFRGSIIGMQIYHRIALVMEREIDILLLDENEEKRWNRIAEADLKIGSRKLKLKRGRADFSAMMYGESTKLEIMIYPKDIFACSGRVFVVVKADIPFAGNSDFLTIYLCELKNGSLSEVKKCKNEEELKKAIEELERTACRD